MASILRSPLPGFVDISHLTTAHEIEALIEATHFPYKVDSQKLDLLGKIIRDADLAQALSPVWIQQVVIGLAREAGVSPLAMLKAQSSFLTGLRFNTPWAQQLFPQELIDAKIAEAEKLRRLLESPIDRPSFSESTG
jgi:hypothetical protein